MKDLKALKLASFNDNIFQLSTQKIEEIENYSVQTLHEYISANLQLKEQLLDRAKTEMKSTQRLIQSRIKVETEQTLNEHVEGIKSRVKRDE